MTNSFNFDPQVDMIKLVANRLTNDVDDKSILVTFASGN